MIKDWLIKTAIGYAVPQVAAFLKPYLTAEADTLIVIELRVLSTKVPAAAQVYVTAAVDALASAWGV